jgi:hypothetical protein
MVRLEENTRFAVERSYLDLAALAIIFEIIITEGAYL